MKMKSNCPVNYGLEHFGDKWCLLILRDLIFRNKRHYNDFLESNEKISTRVLRDKLLLLQEGGIITKGPDLVKKSRIRYSLTEKGIALAPLLIELVLWSVQFDPNSKEVEFIEKLKSSDKLVFSSKLGKKLRNLHLEKTEKTNANIV